MIRLKIKHLNFNSLKDKFGVSNIRYELESIYTLKLETSHRYITCFVGLNLKPMYHLIICMLEASFSYIPPLMH